MLAIAFLWKDYSICKYTLIEGSSARFWRGLGYYYAQVFHKKEQSFEFRVSSFEFFGLEKSNRIFSLNCLEVNSYVECFELNELETRNSKLETCLFLIHLTLSFVVFGSFFRVAFGNIDIAHICK